MTLRKKIFVVMSASSLFITCTLVAFLYIRQRAGLLKGIDQKLQTAATMAQQILPGNYHDRITGADSVPTDEYEQIVNRYDALCKTLGLEYIWSLMLIDGRVIFTTATSADKRFENGKYARFYEPHSNPELYLRTFQSMTPTYQINDDKWGRIRVALIPFRDEKGRPYLFGASIRLTEVEGQLREIVYACGAGALFVMLLSAVGSAALAKMISKPISRLAETLREHASGPTTDSMLEEQAVLARAFDQLTTTQREAQDATRRTEELLRILTENVPDLLWVCDAETFRLTYASNAAIKMLGYSPEELKETSIDLVMAPDSLSLINAVFPSRIEAFRAGDPKAVTQSYELEQVRKDGTKVWTDVATTFRTTAEGNIRIFGVTRDISDRRRIEHEILKARESAEAAMQAKSDFLAYVSHEVRTPLNGVYGMLELLLDTPLSEEQLEYAGTVRSSISLLLQILNNTMDLSKIEAGKMQLRYETFKIASLLEETRRIFHPLALEKNLSIRISIDQNSPPVVSGDTLRLQQVLSNLLSNSIKFTPPHGVITLSAIAEPAREEDISITFSVSDTGIGISQEKQAGIFEAFTQADSSTAHTYGGTGLGLTISSQLVRLMGGALEVKSHPGEGATFSFTCPFSIPGSSTKEKCVPVSIEKRRPEPLNVLVVEDNAINSAFLLSLLSRAGHKARLARDGNEAVNIYREGPFNVVLMDIQMPSKNGLEATMEIRAIEEDTGRPKSVIVGLTAYGFARDRKKYLDVGMDEHFTKPVCEESLLGFLAALQRKHQATEAPSRTGGFSQA